MQMDQYLRSSSSSHFDLRVYGCAARGLSVSTKVETAEVTSLFRAHSSGSNVLLNLASAISAFSCTHLSTFSARAAELSQSLRRKRMHAPLLRDKH
jgi:hypothetical protein